MILLATSKDAILLKRRGFGLPLEDVVGNEPGRYYSPRHMVPFNSRNEGSKCATMTWRAIYARPLETATQPPKWQTLGPRLALEWGAQRPLVLAEFAEVGRCRLTVSKPALKAPTVSALETIIS